MGKELTLTPGLPATAGKRRVGRPVAQWLSLAEVAPTLGLPEAVLARLLKLRPGLVPGALCEDGIWQVPESGLCKLLGTRRVEVHASIGELSEATGIPYGTIYQWTRIAHPETGEKLLPSVKLIKHVLVPVKAFFGLPERMPAWAPASFFGSTDSNREVAA